MLIEKKYKPSFFFYRGIIRLFNDIFSINILFFRFKYYVYLCNNNNILNIINFNVNEIKMINDNLKYFLFLQKKSFFLFLDFKNYFNLEFDFLSFGKGDYENFFLLDIKLKDNKIINSFNKEIILIKNSSNLEKIKNFNDVINYYKDLLYFHNLTKNYKITKEYDNFLVK